MRTRAGVFDVCHMGEIETRGPQAAEFLQHLLSNDVAQDPRGRRASTRIVCRQDGGIVDDLFIYRLAEEHFLTVTNAANHDKDLAWFQRQAEGFDVDVTDRADDFAMLAVQGPQARGDRRAAHRRPPARRASTAAARGRRRRRCSSPARATPARTASSCCSTPTTRSRCGTR